MRSVETPAFGRERIECIAIEQECVDRRLRRDLVVRRRGRICAGIEGRYNAKIFNDHGRSVVICLSIGARAGCGAAAAAAGSAKYYGSTRAECRRRRAAEPTDYGPLRLLSAAVHDASIPGRSGTTCRDSTNPRAMAGSASWRQKGLALSNDPAAGRI